MSELARARAESFARRLTTRLRSLAGDDGDEHPASSCSDNEVFYDVDSPPARHRSTDSSSDSLYLDSVDELPTRLVPLLRLRTEQPPPPPPPPANGRPPVLDADVGCSRVREYYADADEEEIQCLRSDGPEDEDEEGDCTVCVFCDVDQIKSSLADDLVVTDNRALHASEVEVEVDREEPVGIEEDHPLSDLLQILKVEISNDDDKEQNSNKDKTEENGDGGCSRLECDDAGVKIEIESDGNTIKVDDEEFDIQVKRKNFRRCSSLKSGKTPPGTPARKKMVRFADVLGLDLADVKTFLDEVPTIPTSAYEDLHGIVTIVTAAAAVPDKMLQPLFQQPCAQPNFLDRVRRQHVCLENATVSDTTLFAVTGLVRVDNVDFHKSVYVRYTIDDWRTYSDLRARYVADSCDGFSDKFTFVVYAHTLAVGQSLQFAVRFHAAGHQFWDSNGGANYKFECVARHCAPPPRPPDLGPDSATFY